MSELIKGETPSDGIQNVQLDSNKNLKVVLASDVELGSVEIQDKDGTNRLVIDGDGKIGVSSPSTVAGGVKTVTTAGTGLQIISASTPSQYVIITALLANTGTIYVGGADVDKTTMNGIALTVAADKDGIKIPGSCIIPINNANKIWIDATVNGNGVSFVVV